VTAAAIPPAEYAGRRRRAGAALRDWGVDALLVTTPSDLRYLTGYGGISPLGLNPFTGGLSAALLITAGGSVLCLPQQDAGLLPRDPELDVRAYQTFLQLMPLYPRRQFADAFAEVFRAVASGAARLGLQPESAPAVILEVIEREAPRLERVDLAGVIGLLRMRKSDAELAAIRRSISICDAAQAAVRDRAAPGVVETDILDAIRDTVVRLAGGEVPLIHEVTSGPRSGRIGFTASDRELREGDLLLTDIAPQVAGYWGDSCATQPIGEVDEMRARMLSVSEEALVKGTAAVRPGALTSDVDRLMRDHVAAAFPAYHNSGGHGIGLDYHEPPRLVPAEEIALDEGMVIAMEPGVYLPDVAGVRLEHVVLVTADGCEVLSEHVLARA
jgi:Xaa-Pro aminopeptidase